MAAMYGNRFADMWRGTDLDEVKKVWAEKLGAYSREELAAGGIGLDTRDWPPTLPEFLKLCRPPIDPASAHAEAVAKYPQWVEGSNVPWSRPEVFWAAQSVGYWDLKNTPYQYIAVRWRAALEAASKDAVPPARIPLAAPEFVPVDKEIARKILDGCVIKRMPTNNAQIMVEQKAATARRVAAALAAQEKPQGENNESR